MELTQLLGLGFATLRAHRMRSVLSMLGIAIGIAAVMLLTSIGEGTRRYLLDQFTQFGTNLMQVNPGKTETVGIPGVLGGSTRKLTLEDAEAIRRLPGVVEVVPVAFGLARVEANNRGRSVFVYGVSDKMPQVWKFEVRQGTFLPPGDPRKGAAVTVLGPRLKRELFGEENALGQFVRVAGQRLRVVGVMIPKGQMLGFDLDDTLYVPVATTMRMFNLDELQEIDILYANASLGDSVAAAVRRLLTERHGREDFTVLTQTEMLRVFGNVMNIITISVGGIAGISLLVGAIGILTMMWIGVGERTGEIGLIRAVGATTRQVFSVFLVEAVLLALGGGAAGIAFGLGVGGLIRLFVPGLPISTPLVYVGAAVGVSVVTGVVAGVLPARRAALLDPIESLRAE